MDENDTKFIDRAFLCVMTGTALCMGFAPWVLNRMAEFFPERKYLALSLMLLLPGTIYLAAVMIPCVLTRSFRELFQIFRFSEAGKIRNILLLFLESAGAFLAVAGITFVWKMLLSAVGCQSDSQIAIKLILGKEGTIPAVTAIGSALFLAPVAEELAFRYILYLKFKKFSNGKVAAFAASLLFATAHLSTALIPGLFVLGLLLQSQVKRHGLACGIIMHALFNFINIALLLMFRF